MLTVVGVVVLIVPSFLSFSLDADETQTQIWSENIKLSYEALNPYRPEICVDENNIYVVWADARYDDIEIFFKKSTDGGKTWSDDIRLTNNSYQHTEEYWCNDMGPTVGINGNNIHVVWDRNIGSVYSPNFELYYIRSTNGGEKWDVEKQLTNSSGSASAPSIAANGENVYVVWADNKEGSDKLYYKHSEDNGVNWDEEIKLSDTGAGYTDIVAYSNNIHVVWSGGFADPYIRYKRSIDGGNHWDEDKTLTNDPTQPRIAVDGNNVYVVWFRWKNTESGNDEIFYKKSMDNGENWSEDIRFAHSYHGHQARIPDVAASNGNVYVVWQDGRDNNIELYYKVSGDSGATWSNDTRLTYDLDDSYDSSIAMYEENAYVVWVGYNFTEDWTYVYFKRTVPYPGFLTENLSLLIVSVLSPKRWDTVKGVVEIRGTAKSTNPNTTIQKVEIKIDPDGEWEIVSGTTNWSYIWDTTNVSDGKHTLFVRVYDGGSYSEYYVLPLYVRTKGGGLIPDVTFLLMAGIASIGVLLAVGLILLYKRKHKI